MRWLKNVLREWAPVIVAVLLIRSFVVEAFMVPTGSMLNTIFWPNSPLHDLGVIISQGRIAYAGVQFPLAESGDLERELGSRHRAAVGMSQDSDALVLVVSEETGDISIADNGQLIRKLSVEALRTLLQELLGGKPADHLDVKNPAAEIEPRQGTV